MFDLKGRLTGLWECSVGFNTLHDLFDALVVQGQLPRDRCQAVSGTVLLIPLGLKADAMKAGTELGDQVLKIVRIKA